MALFPIFGTGILFAKSLCVGNCKLLSSRPVAFIRRYRASYSYFPFGSITAFLKYFSWWALSTISTIEGRKK